MRNIIEKIIFLFFKRKINFNGYSNLTVIGILMKKLICLLRAVLKIQKFGLVGSFSKITNVNFKGTFNIGNHVRLFSPNSGLFNIGKGFSIGSFSIIEVTKNKLNTKSKISIGENTGFSEFSYINGSGGLEIGDNVISGQYLSIHPENHIINPEILYRFSGVTNQGIKIGNNVWIGSKVTILDGSIIGDNCVIAAGAVVKGVLKNNVLIGGVPAKILKEI
jgi:acetyltransferase-like isoleucine patch superfamily enzyme